MLKTRGRDFSKTGIQSKMKKVKIQDFQKKKKKRITASKKNYWHMIFLVKKTIFPINPELTSMCTLQALVIYLHSSFRTVNCQTILDM